MSQTTQKETKEQIMTAFGKLIAEYKKAEGKVATRQEEAEKEKNQELLATVSDYTIDNIVNGMASLQLDFGGVVKELSEKLAQESDKLEELKQAITVENDHLIQLQKVRLVADVLHILRQEHQEKLRLLQQQTESQQEIINQEISQTRKIWEKEAEEFTSSVTEQEELLNKQRETKAADYEYEIEKKRKVEMDEYEEAKRKQERELLAANQEKEKVWQEREEKLAEQQQEFTINQEKIATFAAKIKEESNKARGEAIKEAERDAKVKADLLEKEWEASKQGYEFKIQSLEATIQKQTVEISEIISQLQAATNQAQSLAMRAFQGSAQ